MNTHENKIGKVLVVDDHLHSRMTVTDLLTLDGYEVMEEETGAAAIQCAKENLPDLILLDIMLPQMNGFEICAQLKQDQLTSGIPIIMMTVEDERKIRLQSQAVGSDDFLPKPLDRWELSTKVKSLIHKKRLNEQKNQIEAVLFSMVSAIESRYSEGTDTCGRLAFYAQSFGEYLQLPSHEIQNLVYAAYLHDIGTVGMPDAVLLKKGALTSDEAALVKQHVLIGEQICQPLSDRPEVLSIIRHHHERWDGSGYPDGLVGHDIPWLAQVFQILDIYVALTSDRPHKLALSQSEALQIIQEEMEKGWRNPFLIERFTAFLIGRDMSSEVSPVTPAVSHSTME